MKWKKAKLLPAKQFKRMFGVKPETFETMVFVAKKNQPKSKHKVKGKKRGPKPKLNWYDKVLMLLMYYREYRTFANTGSSYGISEPQCWRIITEMEKQLLKSKCFHLPGKKKLQNKEVGKVVVVDVSEHPIERPKKNKENIIPVKRKNMH